MEVMETADNITGGELTDGDVVDKEIKVEVSTNPSDDEQSEAGINHENETDYYSDAVNNITKEEFMKNSELKKKLNEQLVLSKNKMEESTLPSKSNTMVNGQSMVKKPGVRFGSDSSPAIKTTKIAKMSPRATRSSQNPDFAAKQRKFLNRVHDPIRRDFSDSENSQDNTSPIVTKVTKEKKSPSVERKLNNDTKKKPEKEKEATPKRPAPEIDDEEEGPTKKKRTKEPTKVVGGVDSYCWRCHRDGNVIRCEGCPRVYHLKCVQMEEAPSKGWVCPECITLMQAENTDTRSRAMRMLTLDQLCNLLRFTLNRMKSHEGADDFARAVDVVAFPNYRDYIVKPMDLALLERNIKAKMYGSTEAFLADAKWIVHNSIIFNSAQSQFTNVARAILKICRQETQEIENCPDCYQNAHTRSSESWFIEACRRPHLLVWAKLKGFPFWPAKAMTTNSEGLVDVRFFGAHDRAWVPVNCCYLFSKLSPVPASNKNRRNLEDCLQELELHIKKLKDKFGQFEYPPYKTPYDPKNEDAQLAMFLPKYDAKGAGKRSRMSLLNDGARKSLLGSKSTPTTLGKRLPEDTAPSKSQTEDSPSPKSKVAKDANAEGAKQYTPDMVSFPAKASGVNEASPLSKSNVQSDGGPQKSKDGPSSIKKKNLNLQTPPSKQENSLGLKKTSHRTPLTAAAKKCFAMDEKTCFRCKLVFESTLHWSTDNEGNTVCSTCAEPTTEPPKVVETRKEQSCIKCQLIITDVDKSHQENGDLLCAECVHTQSTPESSPAQIKGKCCSVCRTCITMRWLRNSQGSLLCSSCGYAERFKKAENTNNGESSTMSGIITIQRKLPVVDGIGNEPDILSAEERTTQGIQATEMEVSEDCLPDVGESITPKAPNVQENSAVNSAPVDSPPKFIIQKTNEDSQKPTKKANSIVDYLHEKICFAVEEAIKHSVPVDEDPVPSTSTAEDVDPLITSATEEVGEISSSTTDLVDEPIMQTTIEVEPPVMEVTEPIVPIREPVPVAQVILHDLKNDKLMAEKLKAHEGRKKQSDLGKNPEIEIRSLSETSSDIDDSSVEEIVDEENDKKKKHIDNVVRTLTERKGSVDERSDQSKSPITKESNTMILDDTNEDGSVLIIDEGESNSPDSKSSDKGDKSRRKGTPAKVLSRSSSSAESSPNIDEHLKSRLGQQVLDEVSGKFRRSSEDSNVTITVVTDDTPPPKKTNELRSVNISKSLSLSVVNESSASLEMECIGSDLEDQVTVNPIVKKLKPTARKTLPKPPKIIDLPSSSNNSNEPEVIAVMTNPRSVPPTRPAPRVYGPGKAQIGGPPGLMAILNPSATSRSEELSVQINEASAKMSSTLQNVVMDLLRGLSDNGCLEATVRLLQIELEQTKQRQKHEINEVAHNAEITVKEYLASMEADKQRELLDAKHKFEMEKERVIQETKRKTWCTFCPKEATLYCCWNTAYCTYTCQQAHWSAHMESCSNKQQDQSCRPAPSTQPQQTSPVFNMPLPQMHAPDDAWYEEDLYDSETTKGQKHVARKRCGICQGCLAPHCGECYGCTNPKSHTVCKNRRCVLITARTSQRMRQMMPPPVNPPPYNQPYRPNQMYTVGPRFPQGLHVRPPLYNSQLGGPYHPDTP